jgi:hypothetical protein
MKHHTQEEVRRHEMGYIECRWVILGSSLEYGSSEGERCFLPAAFAGFGLVSGVKACSSVIW